MPSPKSGTAVSLVSPASPQSAADADDADPGETDSVKAEQRQAGKGKYGSVPSKPFKPESPVGHDPATKLHWVKVKLVDTDGQPMSGEAYRITLPDGSVAEGTLGTDGMADLKGIATGGSCDIEFPNLDKDAWKPA